jgi:hypothetical protein
MLCFIVLPDLKSFVQNPIFFFNFADRTVNNYQCLVPNLFQEVRNEQQTVNENRDITIASQICNTEIINGLRLPVYIQELKYNIEY